MTRPLMARIALSLLILVSAFAIAVRQGSESLAGLASNVPPAIYAAILACLIINAVTAAARFSFIAGQVGGAYQFRDAVAIVSAGNIAGALFFQIAGQLAARTAIMARSQGGSFASAVVITAYERLSAAVVSGLGAVAGAYIVFGRLYFDWGSGAEFVKLAIVGALALACGVALSGARDILPRLNSAALKIWGGALAFSATVQFPVMAAYMLAAHALAPSASILELFGATLIVMFAASIPVSFAGWGVRELSAVVALGAIGIDPGQALLTAILIGFGSMLAAGICAAITLPSALAYKPRLSAAIERADYAGWLALAIPIAAAIAVPFQVYLPVGNSIVNANLADPLALMGAALFGLRCVTARRIPTWRYWFIGYAGLIATAAIGVALLIGFAHFGVTTWALMNRFAGWLVLLAYVATGALVVSAHGSKGAAYVVGAFVGSMAAVAAGELALLLANKFFTLPDSVIATSAIKGFAQNRNAFAFQLLIAIAVALSIVERKALGVAAIGLLVAALALTFSRSGIGTGAAMLASAALFGTSRQRRFLLVAAFGAAVAILAYWFVGAHTLIDRITVSAVSGFAERMKTISGGLRLFADAPLFGSGLGAYRHENNLSGSGEPLVIHSTYIWLLAETGLFGLLAFMVPAVVVFASELRRARFDKVAFALVLCLGVMAAMGIPADMLFQRTFWLIVGALLAVPAIGCTTTADAGNGRSRMNTDAPSPPLS